MENLVTVVIPCYNDGAYIQKAVDSILGQTFTDYKIIIVDDGSNKSTKEVLTKIIDQKIEIICQENLGVSAARNKAINISNTKYILTLDADDYFEPTFLEKAIEIIERDENIAVVGCYYNIIVKKRVTKIIKPLGGGVENFFIKNNGLGNSLFRKKCWEEVGGYDESMLRGYEDWEFWISILSKGWEMKIIKEALFSYRIKQVSRDQIALKNHHLELKKYIFNKHLEVFKQHYVLVSSLLFEENHRLGNVNSKLKESREYKLGKMISRPLKFIKQIINKL